MYCTELARGAQIFLGGVSLKDTRAIDLFANLLDWPCALYTAEGSEGEGVVLEGESASMGEERRGQAVGRGSAGKCWVHIS